MTREITIDGRRIGPDHPPYVICEISANHNGSLERMLEILEASAATGCDAVKIQTYTPDTMTIESDRPEYRIEGGLWDGRTLYDLYQEAYTPYEWHETIFAKARELGITLFSTPFDSSAVVLLESLDAPAYKIASFELVDLPLVAEVARCGKPMIMSTGLASLSEIEAAVQTARDNGSEDLVLLHCTSAYPAPSEDANVRTIPHLASTFDVIAGLSDHTPGTAVAVAAVALGASVVEKHFTLARADGGPDSAFSLQPDEFAQLTLECKSAWEALGKTTYKLQRSERENLKFRRSLCAVENIKAGETLSAQNIRSIRPGFGLSPKHLPDVLGRKASKDIPRGAPLTWQCVA